MTIYLFDFDNTIVKLPYPETYDYMDTPESLEPSLGFKLIKRTQVDYQNAVQKNNGPLFLLSNRLIKVKDPIKQLLKTFGYKFDGHYLIDNEDRNKGTRIKKILEKYPGCNHIKYWEDKDKHIDSVTETLKEYPDIKLEVVKTI